MMKILMSRFFIVLSLTAGMLGCASTSPSVALFDLGPLHSQETKAAGVRGNYPLPAISIDDIRSPAWLDSQMMFYRLGYANDQQPRPYSASKWTMPPAQLFQARLKSRISQNGGVVVPASDGAMNLPVLKIEADEFSQVFASANQSTAQITMRASLYDGRTLRAQKLFSIKTPAASADAQGGAAALAVASDAIINEMAVWLANLPPKK